jgi:hypothetical protein
LPFSLVVRVADVIADLLAFTANITNPRHDNSYLQTSISSRDSSVDEESSLIGRPSNVNTFILLARHRKELAGAMIGVCRVTRF